jgi:hypothetical protein
MGGYRAGYGRTFQGHAVDEMNKAIAVKSIASTKTSCGRISGY